MGDSHLGLLRITLLRGIDLHSPSVPEPNVCIAMEMGNMSRRSQVATGEGKPKQQQQEEEKKTEMVKNC